ncbi:SapB/AmfS family lanthipeptide [Actinosynnema sp. NPDC004786]
MSIYDLQGMENNDEVEAMASGWSFSCCNPGTDHSSASVTCHQSFV